MKAPRFFWRLMQVGPKIVYTLGLGPLFGHFVLLLTTIGRKSGKRRVTPLVHEEINGTFYVASARGASADWFQNIQANPNVEVRVGGRRFDGLADVVTDPVRIADHLERLMARNPGMFGAILRAEGLSANPSREELEAFAPKRPMVAIRANKEP